MLSTYRDLNPLHDVIDNREYKEKYYKHLLPLGMKYAGVRSVVVLYLKTLHFCCHMLPLLCSNIF